MLKVESAEKFTVHVHDKISKVEQVRYYALKSCMNLWKIKGKVNNLFTASAKCFNPSQDTNVRLFYIIGGAIPSNLTCRVSF
jgi:hypothetical protein